MTFYFPGYQLLEKLHESSRTQVFRGRRLNDDLPVVLKLACGYRGDHGHEDHRLTNRFRRELALAGTLKDDHVICYHGLESHDAGPVLVIEDFGAIALNEHMPRQGMAPLSFLRLAIQLARGLGAIHRNNIVHKDLKPANIVVNPETGRVKIIDFGISSQLNREMQAAVNPVNLEGTPAYISPEQTGRMNRAMDYRTDFYSLGITFYELLTGATPFHADDSLEMVHCHIAREPKPLHEVKAGIPETLAGIVRKLLAKNAEARYQSAHGLEEDLGRCLSALEETGEIAPFALARRDVSDKFQIPQKLYGRERETELSISSFARASEGGRELLLVSGHAGVGKSALVNEIRKPAAGRRAYFIAGKFDQLARNQAYSAISAAFCNLVDQVLGEREEAIANRRAALLEVLGPNAGLLTDLIPDLELLIGSQPPVSELPADAAEKRFKLAFRNFVSVCAGPEHPLVLFLDDLQWADPSSLRLLEQLLLDKQIHHLLLIGAFRDNEVTGNHHLSLVLDRLKEKSLSMEEIQLDPLGESHLTELIADTLHCPRQEAGPLAEVIRHKTNGNPFFTEELLRDLYRRGLLRFDHDRGRWCWDPAQVRDVEAADNVVAFTIERLRRLPPPTQRALKLGACFGNRFGLRELAQVLNFSPPATAHMLWPALQAEVVLPLSDSYRLVALQDEEKGECDDLGVHYRFRHDRVQQAAYALIPEKDKARFHLIIGRALYEVMPEAERHERVIDIAGHLNKARALIEKREQLDVLARINLEAGKRALASIAYSSAQQLLGAGLDCLPEPSCAARVDAELSFELHRHFAQACFFVGDTEKAEAVASRLLNATPDPLVKAKVYEMCMEWATVRGNLAKAVDLGLEAAHSLGIRISEKPLSILARAVKIFAQLRFRKPARLASLPEIDDQRVRVAMRLLTPLSTAAYISGRKKLLLSVSLGRLSLALKHGNSPESAIAYYSFGLLLGLTFGRLRAGKDFADLALNLIEHYPGSRIKCRLLFSYGVTILPWHRHWREIKPLLDKAVETGLQSGDFFHTAASCYQAVHWHPDLDLATGVAQFEKYLAILADLQSHELLEGTRMLVRYRLALMGRTKGPTSLSDEQFDEEALVAMFEKTGSRVGLAIYHTVKAILCYLGEDHPMALKHVTEAEQRSAFSGTPFVVEICFFSFLIRAALFPTAGAERKARRKLMRKALRRMRGWATHCPENFEQRHLLMEAEQARLKGRQSKAALLYQRAADAAARHGYPREEALAYRLAAQHHRELGLEQAANFFRRQSDKLFRRWGAVPADEPIAPEAVTTVTRSGIDAESNPAWSTRTNSGDTAGIQSLDLDSVVKSARAISSEIDYDLLLNKMMAVISECAGAQNATLIAVDQDGQRLVEAYREEDAGGRESVRAVPLVARPKAESGIVRYVFRSGKHVVLAEATRQGRFTDDPYVVQHGPKSVLCMPIRAGDRISGVLYLENNLVVDAFSEDRVALLGLLVSQAAISLENARLFTDTRRAEARMRRFNEELEQRVQERTTELELTQRELVDKAHQAGMAEIATSVLHNVGNLLNSVITSAQIINHTVESSRTLGGIHNAGQLLRSKIEDPVSFIRDDPRGMDLLRYYLKLDDHAGREKRILVENTRRLTDKIASIRGVIMEQQRLASGGFQVEELSLATIVEDVLQIMAGALSNHRVEIETRFEPAPALLLPKNKLLHVVINLLKNAVEAVIHLPPDERKVVISVGPKAGSVVLEVADNGVGISRDDLERVFQYGFTTKKEGHGFGLHASANAVAEMGGKITAAGEGVGKGAVFTLYFPLAATELSSQATGPVQASSKM